MSMSETENQIYQNTLKHIPALMLNLIGVKVTNYPTDFITWCHELNRICRQDLKMELLDPAQLPVLKKLQDVLQTGISVAQVKMLRIAPWPIFTQFIFEQKQIHALDERLALLNYLHTIVEQPLAEMVLEDRLAFSGKHTTKHDVAVYKFDVEWFASTKGARVFHELLLSHPEAFDLALTHIPLNGDISFQDYTNFVDAYTKVFTSYAPGEKAPLMAATRLLAMRRPDQFIALTNAKVDVLCQGFGIVKLKTNDFNAYWHDFIGTLRTMSWWHQAAPEEATEIQIWNNRAVMVDLFLYADESSPLNSNYLRSRNKPTKKQASTSVGQKRSRESAEALVDKALAQEGVPEYIKNKRDSIVIAVKDGKSVDHVLNMMRAIFG